MTTLGDKIKLERTKQGLSQDDLADRLSIHRSIVSRWETGKAEPTEDQLAKLADIFRISLEELTGQKQTEPSSNPVKEFDATILIYVLLLMVSFFVEPFGIIPSIILIIYAWKNKLSKWYIMIAVVVLLYHITNFISAFAFWMVPTKVIVE